MVRWTDRKVQPLFENRKILDRLDYNKDIGLFSQTTMSLDGFHQIVDEIRNRTI